MPTSPPAPPQRLGDRLLAAGFINPHQLELALREQRRTGRLIGDALHELGFVSQEEIATFLAQDSQSSLVEVADLEVEPEAIRLLPYEFCKERGLLPCRRSEDTLTVVMGDPFNVVAIDQIERLTRLKIEVLNAPRADILERLGTVYDREDSLGQTIDELMKISGRKGGDETAAPVTRAIEQIVTAAVRKSASDIHFEPDEKSLRIRMRHDGLLRPFVIVPKDLQEPFIAAAEGDGESRRLRNAPAAGRPVQLHPRPARELNMRMSCLPTNFGESIVLRILDGGSLLLEARRPGHAARRTRSAWPRRSCGRTASCSSRARPAAARQPPCTPRSTA